MYDAIVVGAGPGGATTAAFLADDGQRVLLLDRSAFPRDKICGDAIGGKCTAILDRLGLIPAMQRADAVGSWGVTFGGPYGDEVAIPFTKAFDRAVPPGFICARTVFDNLLFDRAVELGAEFRQATVDDLLWDDDRVAGVQLKAGEGIEEVHAPLVVGADGAYSVVARSLGIPQLDEQHYCAGVRAYYQGVTGFHARNHVELHYVDDAIPGYFWVFPMANGGANVGVGMLSASVKKRGVKLKELLEVCVAHPRFRERFAGAERVGPVKGWGLPLGSKRRTMVGAGWLLVGDAASLIDPFTGEGIGNAMISGEKAAQWARRAKDASDFSAAFLRGYESEVMDLLRGELRISYALQRLGNWKWLLNTVIRKASRSEELADTISCMFDDVGERRRLLNPAFYLRVLAA